MHYPSDNFPRLKRLLVLQLLRTLFLKNYMQKFFYSFSFSIESYYY